MTGIIKLNDDILDEAYNYQQDYVIPGLSKGEFGFIIAPPGTGKGYFCLSLAYELASTIDVVGIKSTPKPIKVVYWPAEEKKLLVLKRIKKHVNTLPAEVREAIFSNLSIYDNYEPICAPTNMFGSPMYELVNKSRAKLIEVAKEADLLIIDTLREAAGACKEVENDLEIKLALQEIAGNANCAVLATHHPTKEIIKKKEAITSVAGSGLSLSQATSRYALYLETGKDKNTTFLSHTKHNNVEQVYVQNNTKLHWTNESLIHNPELFISMAEGNFHANEEDLVLAEAAAENPIKASSINLSNMKIPKEELEHSQKIKAENSFISNADKEKYKAFIKQQSKDER